MGYMEHLISDIWEYGTPNMGLWNAQYVYKEYYYGIYGTLNIGYMGIWNT